MKHGMIQMSKNFVSFLLVITYFALLLQQQCHIFPATIHIFEITNNFNHIHSIIKWGARDLGVKWMWSFKLWNLIFTPDETFSSGESCKVQLITPPRHKTSLRKMRVKSELLKTTINNKRTSSKTNKHV